MKIYVTSEEICTHEEYSDEEFGHWSKAHDFEITNVSVKKPTEYHDVFDLEVQKGSRVYVLVLRYSTGDSFGKATGKGEIVWAFSEHDFAERVYYEYINNSNKDSLYLMFEVDNKKFKRTKIGNTVSGYFEDIESLEIIEHIVS